MYIMSLIDLHDSSFYHSPLENRPWDESNYWPVYFTGSTQHIQLLLLWSEHSVGQVLVGSKHWADLRQKNPLRRNSEYIHSQLISHKWSDAILL